MNTNSSRKNNMPFADIVQKSGLVIALILVIIILYFDYNSFQTYSNVLIKQQETELLSIARIVGDNLNNFLNQERDKIDVTFSKECNDLSEVHDRNKYLLDDSFPLYKGYVLIDKNSNIVDLVMPGGRDSYREDRLISGAKKYSLEKNYRAEIVGKNYDPKEGEFALYLKKSIRVSGNPYTAVYALDLTEIYNRIIKPVRINGGGYIYIKDTENTIIMHPVKEEIGTTGFQSIYENTTGDPTAFDDMFRWNSIQKRDAEGFDVINIYTRDNEVINPETVIGAFTKLYIQNEEWTVTAILPMEVLSQPLNQFLSIFLIITLIMFMIAIIGTAVVMNIIRQNREINYLREINSGMEMIQKQSDEIRNYQRIQSLGMMSSHIAHEFNNFLTPVMVYVDLLESDPDISEENHELLKQMSTSLDQAKQLSTDLLSFARQDTGAKLNYMDLRDETEKAVNMVKRLTPHKIKFESEITDEDIHLYGRNGSIEHILLNLCKNAFDAMENSEERLLRVTLKKETDEAILTVSDTGCGIPNETIERIYEPFYTTKGSRQGTGLGLSVVRNTVTSMGGRMNVKSSNKGTTFTIHFPVKEYEQAKTLNRLAAIRRIAIIHNKRMNLKRIDEIFKGSKYLIEYFDHPAAVISIIQRNKHYFGMVISSYHTPIMNGVETLNIIRSLNPEIRLILTSQEKLTEFEWYLNNGYFDRHITLEDLYKELSLLISSDPLNLPGATGE
ncbi:sensor histidine kinase [Oribacterium sp. FC2011]|uniref:sensor histidine kinase n=1 Tax=Oribacterium sp. FC2011 TaxID=1408311 RepID=UPI0004E1075E|nr:sensor histidine kinase [Oribacterium sp. FC2011]